MKERTPEEWRLQIATDKVLATVEEIILGQALQKAAGVPEELTDYPLPVYLRQAREIAADKDLKFTVAQALAEI